MKFTKIKRLLVGVFSFSVACTAMAQDLIAKQTAESAKKQKSKSASKSGGYSMTQKEKVVAGGFAKNKGLGIISIFGVYV